MSEGAEGYRERRKLTQRCGQDNCPAKWGYIEDGLLYCRYGHLQSDFQLVEQDEIERYGASQGQTSRVERDTQTPKKSRVFTGQRGLDFWLICQQHILRIQCNALIREKNFPPNFERSVKDLWALRVPLIRSKFGAKLGPAIVTSNVAEQTGPGSTAEILYGSQQQNRDAEVQNVDGNHRLLPSATDGLALLYIAAITVRIPLRILDIHNWAISEEIPFRRIEKLLPADVVVNLDARYLRIFNIMSRLSIPELYDSVKDLILLYEDKLAFTTPQLNYRSLLFIHIQALTLPIELYRVVEQIAAILEYDFRFLDMQFSARARSERRKRPDLPEAILMGMLVVSTKLYHPFRSASNIAVSPSENLGKLGFSWSMWSQCRSQLERRDVKQDFDILIFKSAPLVQEEDVFAFSPTQMDTYMDWYTQTFLPGNDHKPTTKSRPTLSEPLLDMFPIPVADESSGSNDNGPNTMANGGARGDKSAEIHPIAEQTDGRHKDTPEDEMIRSSTRLTTVMKSLRLRKPILEVEQDLRAEQTLGQRYQTFRVPEQLTGFALQFHRIAAELTCTTLLDLLNVIRRIEIRLEKMSLEQLTGSAGQ